MNLRRLVLGIGSLSILLAPLESSAAALPHEKVVYRVVTNEIRSTKDNGQVLEVYRFDPAIFVAQQGDEVTLELYGVKGHDHPVELEGYHIGAVVHKGQVAALHFTATRAGFFRLVCRTHPDLAHHGPMEAYLVVVPSPKRG